MKIKMKNQVLPLLIVFLMLFSMFPTHVYADDTTITTAAISGVSIPIKGETPVSSLADTAEYTSTISWSPDDTTFAADTIYTATITITPSVGYTLTGVTENYFTVVGASSVTNTADSGIVTAVFPKTDANIPTTITIASIAGITVPVKGETPVSLLADTTEYTANISWSPADTAFVADTVYTATITITPKEGYTLTGVTENFFTVTGASTVTNATDSGIITAVFPKTEVDIPQGPEFISATTNETGSIVTITFDKVMADPSLDAASFGVKINGLQLYYVPVTKSIAISSAVLNSDTEKIDLYLSDSLQRGDIVTVDYNLGSVMAADSTTLAAFSAKPVTNIIPCCYRHRP